MDKEKMKVVNKYELYTKEFVAEELSDFMELVVSYMHDIEDFRVCCYEILNNYEDYGYKEIEMWDIAKWVFNIREEDKSIGKMAKEISDMFYRLLNHKQISLWESESEED